MFEGFVKWILRNGLISLTFSFTYLLLEYCHLEIGITYGIFELWPLSCKYFSIYFNGTIKLIVRFWNLILMWLIENITSLRNPYYTILCGWSEKHMICGINFEKEMNCWEGDMVVKMLFLEISFFVFFGTIVYIFS